LPPSRRAEFGFLGVVVVDAEADAPLLGQRVSAGSCSCGDDRPPLPDQLVDRGHSCSFRLLKLYPNRTNCYLYNSGAHCQRLSSNRGAVTDIGLLRPSSSSLGKFRLRSGMAEPPPTSGASDSNSMALYAAAPVPRG